MIPEEFQNENINLTNGRAFTFYDKKPDEQTRYSMIVMPSFNHDRSQKLT